MKKLLIISILAVLIISGCTSTYDPMDEFVRPNPIDQLNEMADFVSQESMGVFVGAVSITYSDAVGWIGTIYLPEPNSDFKDGDDIDTYVIDTGFEVFDTTFEEAVDQLWSRVGELAK